MVFCHSALNHSDLPQGKKKKKAGIPKFVAEINSEKMISLPYTFDKGVIDNSLLKHILTISSEDGFFLQHCLPH